MQREVKDLSGGELQRFAIGVVCVKKADVYVEEEKMRLFSISFPLFHCSCVGFESRVSARASASLPFSLLPVFLLSFEPLGL